MTDPVPSGTRIQGRRIALVLGASLLAVIVLTPVSAALGGSLRRTAHLVLQLGFLTALALSAPRRRGAWAIEAGLAGAARPLRTWLRGLLAGIGGLLAYGLILIALGERGFQGEPTPAGLLKTGLVSLPLAFLIGLLEDVAFFGFLQSAFGGRTLPAALLYAVTHFIPVPKSAVFEWSRPLAGAEALAHMGRSLSGAVERPLELIGLLVVGLVLGGLRRRSGSIWLSMGLHGGWYWQRTVGRKWSEDLSGAREWLFGTDRFCDGILGWVLVIVTGWLLLRPRTSAPE